MTVDTSALIAVRHEAALNFGDCLAYAAAAAADDVLLFVGRDFARTDIRVA